MRVVNRLRKISILVPGTKGVQQKEGARLTRPATANTDRPTPPAASLRPAPGGLGAWVSLLNSTVARRLQRGPVLLKSLKSFRQLSETARSAGKQTIARSGPVRLPWTGPSRRNWLSRLRIEECSNRLLLRLYTQKK